MKEGGNGRIHELHGGVFFFSFFSFNDLMTRKRLLGILGN